ncbi:MAG: alpha/beta fold hydrolase [Opitutales bacterium]
MMQARAAQLPAGIREIYPFSGNTLDLPGTPRSEGAVRMHYLDEGSGPVVLLLHGNPTWSFYYRNLVRELSASGYRCIVPDHVGCGLSDKPPDYEYVFRRRIDDIEHLVDHLGIKRFSLVLHDWGGAIGCGLAVRRPEALNKLVLLNTAAFASMRIPLRIAALKTPALGAFVIRGLNGFVRAALNMTVTTPLSPAVRAGYLWPYRSWATRVAIWNFVKDIPLRKRHPSYPVLEAIEKDLPQLAHCPVFLVWGGRDFCFTRHFLERWRAIFPEAKVSLYENSGHYVLEDSHLEIPPEIAAFLEED